MSINDRIALILEDKHLTANEFAMRLKVQSSNISHIITGRNKPSFSFLEKLALEFPEISTDWLIRGEGSMYITTDINAISNDETDVAKDGSIVGEAHPYQGSLFDLFEEKTVSSDQAEDPVSQVELPSIKETERKTEEISDIVAVKAPASRIKSIIVYYNNGSFEEFLPK